jgi:hypothetical protein
MKKLILLVALIIFAACSQKGELGKKTAKEVMDSLKKCKSEEEVSNWHHYNMAKIKLLKDSADVKAYMDEIKKIRKDIK